MGKQCFSPTSPFPFTASHRDQAVQTPRSWKGAVAKPAQCTLVIGAKNIGKSTFTQYFVNSLVSKGASVDLMDLDSGQCDYSPPGLVSLHRITRPILTTGAFRKYEPCLQHWIGYPSAKEDPEHYLACFKSLLQAHTGPLIINTPGWIRGTGLECLISIVEILKERFDDLQVLHLGHSHVEELIECIYIDGYNVDSQPVNPVELRNMNTMSYLYKTQYGWYRTLSLKPWRMTLETVTGIAVLGESIAGKDIISAINCTIVAIVRYSNFHSSGIKVTHGTTGIGIVQNDGLALDPAQSTCLGIGLISQITTTAIDIITPITLTQFQDLEDSDDALILVTGGIDVPVQMITARDTYRQPYITRRPGTGIGHQPWHVRRNIARKR